MNKIDPNKMSPQELEEYVNNLPEKVPPKWSSVAWMTLIGIITITLGASQIKVSIKNALTMIIGGVCSLGIAGYLIYKIITFSKNGG